MSKSEVLYVKGMNLSESEGEDVDEDVWDDKKLNDAYDKALKIANAEVAKRVAMSTNTQSKNKEEQHKSRKEKILSKGTSKNKKKEDEIWKEGMYCRAVYEEDGMEYEAILVKIIHDNECLVQFIGYNNTEIVAMNSLKLSRGKKEREQQILDSIEDKTDDAYTSQSPTLEKMDCYSDRAPSQGSTERSFHRKKKSVKKKMPKVHAPNGFQVPEMPFTMPNMASLKNLGTMEMPLPPPPPLLGSRADSEEQAISSMLLSWYMSGYYTGLYQGLKRAKENRKNV